MKKLTVLAAFLAFNLAAHAQPAALSDGHDHGTSDETSDEILTPAERFWQLSDKRFHDGDFPGALVYHRGIQAVDPGDVESYSVAAWLSWSLGLPDQSHAFLEKGLKANPNDFEMWDAAGQQYSIEKMAPQALETYKKAVALAGKEAPELLRHRFAHAAEAAGDVTLSAQTWRDLVRDFPDSAVNKNNLARVEKTQSEKTTP